MGVGREEFIRSQKELEERKKQQKIVKEKITDEFSDSEESIKEFNQSM